MMKALRDKRGEEGIGGQSRRHQNKHTKGSTFKNEETSLTRLRLAIQGYSNMSRPHGEQRTFIAESHISIWVNHLDIAKGGREVRV